jgi:hypothetical protein
MEDFMSYTYFPNTLVDDYLHDLSGAEVKVLLYIIRRTLGFGKVSDVISLSQFTHGIRKKDGTVLDAGTGLSKEGVTKALTSLEAKGLIQRERITSREKGYEATRYTLSENLTSPCQKNGQAHVRKSDIQKTVKQNKRETKSDIEAEREAYFQQFAQENTAQLAFFLQSDYRHSDDEPTR